jgi:hypothetical protein
MCDFNSPTVTKQVEQHLPISGSCGKNSPGQICFSIQAQFTASQSLTSSPRVTNTRQVDMSTSIVAQLICNGKLSHVTGVSAAYTFKLNKNILSE